MGARIRLNRRTLLLALAAVLVTAAAFSAAILGTERGRQALLDAVGALASGPDFKLDMRGLRPGTEWTLDSLTVGDAAGPWLRAGGIAARPVFGDLFAGRVTLERLGVGELDLERLPAGGKSSGAGAWPQIRIRSIDAGRIRIGQAVAGQEALLSLRGGVSLDPGEARAELRADRLDRQGDRLGLEGRVGFTDRAVELRLDAHEAPGGLLHELIGVNGTDGISLAVSGRGTLRDCPLNLEGRVSDLLSLAGNATANLETGPELALQARLSPGPAWTGLTGLPPDEVDILAHGSWREPVLRLQRLEAHSRAAGIGGNATWDSASGVLEAEFHGEGKDLSAFMPPAVQAGSAAARARLRLDDGGLHAGVQAMMEAWRVSDRSVPEARADMILDMPAGLDRWQVRADLRASSPDFPDGLRAWTVNASLGGDASSVAVNAARLESEKVVIDFSGRADSAIAFKGRVGLRALPLGGVPLSGTVEAALRGTLDARGPGLSAELSANATGLDGLPRDMEELLGRDGRLLAVFDAGPERVAIRDATLQARTRAALQGEIDPRTGRFSAHFDVTLPGLRRPDVRLDKGAAVRGTAVGVPGDFAMDLDARSPSVAAGGLNLDDVGVTAAMRGLPGIPAVNLRGEAKAAGQAVSLRLEASPSARDMRITNLLLELPGTRLQASGDLDPATLLFAGSADLSSDDLGVPGRILGAELQGRVSARADMSRTKGVQQARLDGRGEGIAAMGLRIGRTSLAGTTSWPGAPGGTDLRIDLATAAYGSLKADRISARLRDADQGLAFQLSLDHAASRTDINADGTFRLSPARLRIDGLQGTLLKERLNLESPLDIGWSPDGIAWRESALSFGRARLTARGEVTPDRSDIAVDLRDMDPAMLRAAFPHLPGARINARLQVQGAPRDPDAALTVRADEIRVTAAGLGNLQDLDADAELRLRGGMLDGRGSVTAGDAVGLDATVSSPVRASLWPFEAGAGGPLAGRIAGHAELGILPTLLRLDDQAVGGRCELDLGLDGTWEKPGLSGTARVRGGRYENFRSGTAVESADVDAKAGGTVVELNATGTDGGSGLTKERDTIDLDGLAYVFDVDFTAFRLVRLDLFQGTATGPFRFAGDLDAAALTGSLTLDPSAVSLPRSTAKEAPHIDIREINTGAEANRKPPTEPRFLIGMDLNVAIPARLSVKGRGLDSEWSGRLHVGGDHVRPALSGEMNLLRGTFDFLDRTFDLTKGSLVLTGETPPNPFVDMLGETTVMDTLVQVHLNGPTRNFRLSLTSIPALPQDELLAMILFGRSMREISPLQAVTLAQAAAEMTGVGANLDVLGAVKSRLGLQEVDVSRDEDDNTAVGIGGYVGGKYYIRTQRSVSGQDRTKVEVQLTPKISVETEVGADSRQGAGITWKHDY